MSPLPPILLEQSDRGLVTDAVYFVVRVLQNGVRGYRNAIVSREPSPKARVIAEECIQFIEGVEGNRISLLPSFRLEAYIVELEAYLLKISLVDNVDALRAAKTALEEMRAGDPVGRI